MRLEIYSREGHFNFLDPSEKSISSCFTLLDGKEEKIARISIETKKIATIEPDYDAVEQVIEYIDEWLKCTWFSSNTQEVEDFKMLLTGAEKLINLGTLNYQITQLQLQLEKIGNKIEEYKLKSQQLAIDCLKPRINIEA